MNRFARAASGIAGALTLGAVAMADVDPAPSTLRRGDPASVKVVKIQDGNVTSASRLRRDADDVAVVRHQDVSIRLNHAKDAHTGRVKAIKAKTNGIPANVLSHYATSAVHAHQEDSK
jgi:hypothetical protein